jgi:hypothetical protein
MEDNSYCTACGAAQHIFSPPETPKKSNKKAIIAVAVAIVLVTVSLAGLIYFVNDSNNKNSAEVTINVHPTYTATNVVISIDGMPVAAYYGVVYSWEYVYHTEKIRLSDGEDSRVITVTATSGTRTDTQTLTIERGMKYPVDLYI